MGIGRVLGAVAPIAAGYFTGGTGTSLFGLGTTGSAITAGALTGAGIAALSGGNVLEGGFTGGLGGMAGGSLQSAFNPANTGIKSGLTTEQANKKFLEGAAVGAPKSSIGVNIADASSPGVQLDSFVNPSSNLPLAYTIGGGASMTDISAINPPPSVDTSFSAGVNRLGGGSKAMGAGKLGLMGLGVAGSAGAFDPDMPEYGDDPMSKYDPKRRLNLGAIDTGLKLNRDTGLRLLAEGGTVRDRSYYGIEPKYEQRQTMYGLGPQPGPVRVPIRGIIDVGGKFKADPKGDITDMEYEKRFKYVTEGVAKPKDSSGDMTDLNAAAAGGAGINPAVALNLAQGFARQQTQGPTQSQTLGLEALAGDAVKYQQGGKTTAEKNKQNIQSMYGDQGKTTAEQNLTRDAIQEAGTVVTQQMGNNLAKKVANKWADLPIVPGDANNNMAKILGVALKLSPESFTVVPNQPSTSGRTSLNLNTGTQEPVVGMNEGGLTGLTPEGGKMLNGMGDGMSDEIEATIEGTQEARLSDGEFVIPADVVSHLGNGSSDAGARRLYEMMDKVRMARTGTKKQGKEIKPERYMPA